MRMIFCRSSVYRVRIGPPIVRLSGCVAVCGEQQKPPSDYPLPIHSDITTFTGPTPFHSAFWFPAHAHRSSLCAISLLRSLYLGEWAGRTGACCAFRKHLGTIKLASIRAPTSVKLSPISSTIRLLPAFYFLRLSFASYFHHLSYASCTPSLLSMLGFWSCYGTTVDSNQTIAFTVMQNKATGAQYGTRCGDGNSC